MSRLGARFVIGLVVLCIGASIALDLVLDVHLPLVRAVLAIVLIAVGARLALRGWSPRERIAPAGEVWMEDQQFAPEGAMDHDLRYDVVFGRGVVDLTHLRAPTDDVTVSIHTLFGATVVKLDPAIEYEIEGSAAMGEVRLPDRSATAMGHVSYRPKRDRPPHLHVRVDAVFGVCQVVEARP